MQMGVSGKFTATNAGQLHLMFNDSRFDDNVSNFTVLITSSDGIYANTSFTVDSTNGTTSLGVGPTLVYGVNYCYTTTGQINWVSPDDCEVDADGTLVVNGDPTVCDAGMMVAGTPCPSLAIKSLVGVINGCVCCPCQCNYRVSWTVDTTADDPFHNCPQSGSVIVTCADSGGTFKEWEYEDVGVCILQTDTSDPDSTGIILGNFPCIGSACDFEWSEADGFMIDENGCPVLTTYTIPANACGVFGTITISAV
jgi:hypothetical protein